MSNAVKYTPDGGNITLTIKEKPNGFSELGCYEFSIEDNGIGMTPEFQKIMFETITGRPRCRAPVLAWPLQETSST